MAKGKQATKTSRWAGRSQARTLSKYREMLRQHTRWSQRNILGLRTFLSRDKLDEPGRRDLLNDFLAACNRGEVWTDAEHHRFAVDYLRAKSLDGIGRLRAGSRFNEAQLDIIGAATHHLIVGLRDNPRHKGRFMAVYRAQGPLGSVTYVGTKYGRIQVLGTEYSGMQPPAGQGSGRGGLQLKTAD